MYKVNTHKANFKSRKMLMHTVLHISLDLLKPFPFRKRKNPRLLKNLKMFQNECSIGKGK